jgi:hypothetical protein
LEIECADWIGELFNGWTDICCKLKRDGREIVTWGAAPSEDLALLKAFSEAIERSVFLNEGSVTSNGFAAHLTRSEARSNALNELIERDLFLCHFLTGTPFTALRRDVLQDNAFVNVQTFSKKLDLRIRYFQLGKSGVLCAADGLHSDVRSGFVIGSSYKDNINQSFLSATIEALRQAYFNERLRRSGSLRALSLNEFLSLPEPDFADHGALALNVAYAEMICPLFDFASSENSISEIDIGSVSFVDLPWIFEGDCPFFISKATSQLAQTMFLGSPVASVLNFSRLHSLSNEHSLNTLPHPFN